MSEPFFPPPQKKEERGPYRAPSPVLAARPPVVAKRPAPAPEAVVAPSRTEVPAAAAAEESFVSRFLWRFGVRVVALGIVVGLLELLVVLSEDGAKWPQAIIVVLGVIGILASPFVLYFRLRRLVRLLFARGDDA